MKKKKVVSLLGASMIVALAFAMLLISGCVEPILPGPQDVVKPVNFVPIVTGCAETLVGTAVRGAEFESREITLKVGGNGIVYDRALSHLCCRKVDVSFERNDKEITIYETWQGAGCRCSCFSETGASIENLPNGDYDVKVIERGTNPNGTPRRENIILNVSVNVPGGKITSNKPKLTLEQMQWCETDADCVAVDEGCCPCAVGGTRLAVNQNLLEKYNEQFLGWCTYADVACDEQPSNDVSCGAENFPVCRAEKCEFSIRSDEPIVKVFFQPMQCQKIPWAEAKTPGKIINFVDAEYGVTLISIKELCPEREVCAACDTCPTVCYFEAEVGGINASRLVEIGWLEKLE